MSTAAATTTVALQNGIVGILDYLKRVWAEFWREEIYYARIMHETGLEKLSALTLRIARERAKGVTMHAGGQEVIQELSKELSLPKRFIIMFWWSMLSNFDDYY